MFRKHLNSLMDQKNNTKNECLVRARVPFVWCGVNVDLRPKKKKEHFNNEMNWKEMKWNMSARFVSLSHVYRPHALLPTRHFSSNQIESKTIKKKIIKNKKIHRTYDPFLFTLARLWSRDGLVRSGRRTGAPVCGRVRATWQHGGEICYTKRQSE